MYKRYDVKKGKNVPDGAIPCQYPDEITGHWPHWVKCDRNNKTDKYHFEAYDRELNLIDGTYELIGPKINGNRENYSYHVLIKHGVEVYYVHPSFEQLKRFLEISDIEGIVFHATDLSGRMCKIRKSDFGIKR